MDFFEVMRSRRSVREFTDEPVGRDDLEKMVEAAIEAPSGCNAQLRQYVIVDAPDVLEQLRPFSRAMKSARAAVVILVEPIAAQFGEFWMQDASAAMENMLLTAVALGYGACWIEGAIRPHEVELRKILGVPESLRIWSLMSIGHPSGETPRPKKSEFSDVAHYNHFGGR